MKRLVLDLTMKKMMMCKKSLTMVMQKRMKMGKIAI